MLTTDDPTVSVHSSSGKTCCGQDIRSQPGGLFQWVWDEVFDQRPEKARRAAVRLEDDGRESRDPTHIVSTICMQQVYTIAIP